MSEAAAVQIKPKQTSLVDLNFDEQVVVLKIVTGADEAGIETVQEFAHRFARQENADVINLLSACATEKTTKTGNARRQKQAYGNRDAMYRYWAKHHTGVKGYPGAEDWRIVPEEDRGDWKVGHQVLAVNELLRAEARIVGSQITFDGGVWQIAVGIPDLSDPAFRLVFSVNEWGQKQAKAIGDALEFYTNSGGGSDRSINAGLYIKTLIDLTRRVDGCTLDGKTWDELTDEGSKQRMLKALYPAWIYRAAEELFNRWESQKRD